MSASPNWKPFIFTTIFFESDIDHFDIWWWVYHLWVKKLFFPRAEYIEQVCIMIQAVNLGIGPTFEIIFKQKIAMWFEKSPAW